MSARRKAAGIMIWLAIGLIALGLLACSPMIPSQAVETFNPVPVAVVEPVEPKPDPSAFAVVTSGIFILILGLIYTTAE